MLGYDPYAQYQEQQRRQQQQAGQGRETSSRYVDLRDQLGRSSRFGDAGEQGFGQLGAESAGVRERLGRIATGQDSISAEQLRQGLQQNLAGMRSMAASAPPQNAAMAARTAMMTGGRQAAGMAGQQAIAGIAERQAADQSLGNMLGQQRNLELQAALGGRGQALGALGGIMGDQTNRYGIQQGSQEPSGWEKALGAGMGIAGLYSGWGKGK